MVTTAANVQRHTVACSIVFYKPNCKARYTVTDGGLCSNSYCILYT